MTRCSSKSFIATILVLANFVLISSALLSYDIRELSERTLFFNDDDIVSQDQMVGPLDRKRSSRYIGDLIAGEQRENEVLYFGSLEISNPTSDDAGGLLTLTAQGIIHFVAVINGPDSYAVICATPETLGTSSSIVGVRVAANSTAQLAVVLGTH